MNKLKTKPDQPEVSPDREKAAGQAINDRWQRANDKFYADWMAKLSEMRKDHPDYPEGALMQMSLTKVRLEAETHDRQAERQWQQANASALAEHMEKVGERTGWNKRQQTTSDKGGDSTKSKFEPVRQWCINEWHKSKHLYKWGSGYSKSKFAEAICNDPRLKALSGMKGGLSPVTIAKVYLNGIE